MKIMKSKVLPAVISLSILILGIGPIGASAATHSKTTKIATSKVVKDSVDEEAKLKVLASILRAGGWVLEKALAPLSKSAANKIKKYRLKIADGLEKAEKTTESGISKGLQKAGIPEDVADDIAKIIVSFLL
ncbi:hypothetical protein Q4O60_08430 [Aeribacillus pallidus]|uniref:hypothetical protein n=1 Tax=unclassified Aeribacillus TaxID=2640495 RepID=UPI0013971E5F|nr:hypothetical protein [Aeribacillus pallidus]BBU38655.1 hypothetical protein APP_09470 [Aeribacillus pallidus]